MKAALLALFVASSKALKVNGANNTVVAEVDKHAKSFNMAAVRAELESTYNVDPEDIITWQFFDRNASTSDDRMIWNTYRRAKKQPANISTIDWRAVPDDMLQKMVETGYMPHKGIPKKVFAMGPWQPEHLEPLTK